MMMSSWQLFIHISTMLLLIREWAGWVDRDFTAHTPRSLALNKYLGPYMLSFLLCDLKGRLGKVPGRKNGGCESPVPADRQTFFLLVFAVGV